MQKDYKKGLVTRSANEKFDFYSGQVITQSFTDEFNESYLTEDIPAYWKYPNMASAVMGGKNMLSQLAGSSTYKIDLSQSDRPKTGLVSSSAQVWSDQLPVVQPGQSQAVENNVWRKSARYSYTGNNSDVVSGDGLTPISNNLPPTFTGWNPGDGISQGWQKEDGIDLYDIYSHPLQAEDINRNYAATIMSSDQTVVVATAVNAKYGEFAYSGAEDITIDNTFSGGISAAEGVVDPLSHSGGESIKLNSDGTSFNVELVTSSIRTMFHTSVWVHETNAANAQFYYQFKDAATGTPIDGAPTYISLNPSITKKSGQWYQFNIDFPVPQNSSELKDYILTVGMKNNGSGAIYMDDFRVHPYDAAVVSYVYNKWGELSHILDNNNLYTEYRYDEVGRLKETYREAFNYGNMKTSEVRYHYAAQE